MFEGLMPAMVTPFDERGELDLAASVFVRQASLPHDVDGELVPHLLVHEALALAVDVPDAPHPVERPILVDWPVPRGNRAKQLRPKRCNP